MVYYVYSKGNKKKQEEDVLIMERLIEVKYDLQLNYEDNEGVSDLSSVIIEMVTGDEYEGLEDMRDWLQAKVSKLEELAGNESDAITYKGLLVELAMTERTLQGVEFGLTMLED